MNFEQFRNYVWGMYGNNTISRDWELYKKSQHALWLARAERAKWVANNEDALEDYREEHPASYLNNFYIEPFDEWSWKWEWAERKCREKAREFE